MSWTDSISDEDSLEFLEERRKVCKSLAALHASELQRWESLKAKVETAIQMKSLKAQIVKTSKPLVAEADLLEHYKKLVDSTGKPEAKAEAKEAKPHSKPDSSIETSATPAAKPAEAIASPTASTLTTDSETTQKVAEPKPTQPTETKAVATEEPIAKPDESTPLKSVEGSSEVKKVDSIVPAEEVKADTLKQAEPEERLSVSVDEPTNLGSLGSKPKMRGSTSRAPPTLKKDALVFTPPVVAPSQSEMEEMEKKRAEENAANKAGPDASAKAKKVQPVGFNPLLGMKTPSGPALKYGKCTDCSCDDFSPDTFKKGKCTNCFHIHAVSKEVPASPSAATTTPSFEDEEDQPPPPTEPFPGHILAKTPESKLESRPSIGESPADQKPVEPLKFIPSEDGLKLPAGLDGGAISPNAKKLIGAKGFNLGLAPTEVSTEPVVKCKECGCDDFSPDSFKKTKCANCFHVHTGAPPPPKVSPKPEEPVAESVPKCKDCGCGSFKSDPFKKSKCSNCFHNHV